MSKIVQYGKSSIFSWFIHWTLDIGTVASLFRYIQMKIENEVFWVSMVYKKNSEPLTFSSVYAKGGAED